MITSGRISQLLLEKSPAQGLMPVKCCLVHCGVGSVRLHDLCMHVMSGIRN